MLKKNSDRTGQIVLPPLIILECLMMANNTIYSLRRFQVQILDLQKRLSSMKSIEQEVQALRSQKLAIEQDMEEAETVQRQGSGGVWRWIVG